MCEKFLIYRKHNFWFPLDTLRAISNCVIWLIEKDSVSSCSGGSSADVIPNGTRKENPFKKKKPHEI